MRDRSEVMSHWLDVEFITCSLVFKKFATHKLCVVQISSIQEPIKAMSGLDLVFGHSCRFAERIGTILRLRGDTRHDNYFFEEYKKCLGTLLQYTALS